VYKRTQGGRVALAPPVREARTGQRRWSSAMWM